MRVLLTGASGFVGSHLYPLLDAQGHDVVRVFRSASENVRSDESGRDVFIPGLDSNTDWSGTLDRIDVVVHLAAMVHVMRAGPDTSLSAFREVNVEGTARLASAAAAAGVQRVIYLSSIKVNGEETFDEPFNADQAPAPADPYAISKAEAEIRLRKLETDTGMDVIIIRPPLVYGPGVKGNLRALSKAIGRGMPLPFGAIDNRRDLVSVYNLCDLIATCVVDTRAAGRTFLVADGETLSTADLIRHMAMAQSAKPHLPRIPKALLRGLGRLLGKKMQIDRLLGNLEIDMQQTLDILDWTPPHSVAESFEKMYRG